MPLWGKGSPAGVHYFWAPVSRFGRARQTWHGVSAELGTDVKVTVDPQLYQADEADLLEIIATMTPDAVGTLMYVGHNPAAAELADGLVGRELEFPTSAIAVIGLPGPWAEVTPGGGMLIAHWTPKAGPRPVA